MVFFTREDFKIGFNFFCVVYGIGTLGIPASFARAGPVYAVVALLLMGLVNITSCVALSKVMLAAPKSVKTYIDVGEWVAGQPGRFAVLIAQFGVCLLVPCAFLVLGGILLDGIAPDAFEPEIWSIIMAATLLPVVLTPTMKEGSTTALVGCLGTLLADGIALYVVADKIGGSHPSVVAPEFIFKEVATMFGNLALAYSAAVMVPELQREHSQPQRMPRVVATTMAFTACLFLTIGAVAYSYVGCQIPGNLLFSINGAALALNASRGSVVLAYLCMQVHISIAFAVILNPVLYLAERTLLGMHKRPLHATATTTVEGYEKVQTPHDTLESGSNTTAMDALAASDSHTSLESLERDEQAADAQLQNEYRGAGVVLKFVALRIAIVALLLICAILFKDHFLDITDFVGASAITIGGILLPIAFYLKVFWQQVPMYQKIVALVVMLFCLATGAYVTYVSGKALFTTVDASVAFPYCPVAYQDVVYTNATHYGEL